MIFDLNSIEQHTSIKITGAIHVGAFLGEELSQYRGLGLTNTILFEPQKKLYDIVKFKCIVKEKVFNVALGSKEDVVGMFISDREGGVSNGAGASSSILAPKKHLTEHPEVTFPSKESINVKRFDKFIEENKVDTSEHNFLNVDVQGYELEVLKGMGDELHKIQIVMAEVNRDEVYESCPMIEDIDSYLEGFGFKRLTVHWQSESWGDAVYFKEALLE
jgi:FkbM family methyltransferase